MNLPRLPVLLALVLPGCFAEQIEPEVPPDAPVELHPASSRLRGSALDSVLVRTDETLYMDASGVNMIRRVAQTSKPTVVSIYTKTKTPVRLRLLPIKIPGGGIPATLPGKALGSGFFIHPSGLVLTNHHVIRDATAIHGITADGMGFDLKVIASDPVYDLALLQALVTGQTFQALPMGSSEEIGAGEPVIAVGNPLGLGHTVSFGIVSQTGRHLSGVSAEEGRQIDYIQMDTPINHGSSGGPLITMTGAWIGVNTAGVEEAQNIGFAVPSSQVREFLEDVLNGRGVEVSP